MKKYTIIRDYRYDDDVVVTLKEGSKKIMTGDSYHDKINAKIDGFFDCLDYLDISYTIEETKLNHE